MDKKTPIQLRIEKTVTNGRYYLEVPYLRIRGKERAMNRWFETANKRDYIPFNGFLDKVHPLSILELSFKNHIKKGVFNFLNNVCTYGKLSQTRS